MVNSKNSKRCIISLQNADLSPYDEVAGYYRDPPVANKPFVLFRPNPLGEEAIKAYTLPVVSVTKLNPYEFVALTVRSEVVRFKTTNGTVYILETFYD